MSSQSMGFARSVMIIRISFALVFFLSLFTLAYESGYTLLAAIPLLLGLFNISGTWRLFGVRRGEVGITPFSIEDLPEAFKPTVSEALRRVSLSDPRLFWNSAEWVKSAALLPSAPETVIGIPSSFRNTEARQCLVDIVVTILAWPRFLRWMFLTVRLTGSVIFSSLLLTAILQVVQGKSAGALLLTSVYFLLMLVITVMIRSISRTAIRLHFEQYAIKEATELLSAEEVKEYLQNAR